MRSAAKFIVGVTNFSPAESWSADGDVAIHSADEWLTSLNAELLATGPALVKLAERAGSEAQFGAR